MKVVAVRISSGQVLVAEEVISSVSHGMAIFTAFEKGDTPQTLATMAEKAVNLRIFEDDEGKLSYSVKDRDYTILCIPNFTLSARTDKGRRPSFENSLPYIEAEEMFDKFVLALKSWGLKVEAGVFGAHMDIKLDLNGPVNIILESNK